MADKWTMTRTAARRVGQALFLTACDNAYRLTLNDWMNALHEEEFRGDVASRMRELLRELENGNEKDEKLASSLRSFTFDALVRECFEHRMAMASLSNAFRHMNEFARTFNEPGEGEE